MTKITATITAVGGYVPKSVLTNKDLESIISTTDEWIFSRTGIRERRILKDSEGIGTSYLAIKAAQDLLSKNHIDPRDIDALVLITTTPDMPVAITGCYVATEIGAVNAFSFDLHAACSGFLYGLSVASAYIESGRYRKVLVLGADKMSAITDYTDRTTCILFGDGAGAVLLEPNTEGYGMKDEYLKSDGVGRKFLRIEAGGSITPASEETVKKNMHFVKQEGQAVFKYAVQGMGDAIMEIVNRNNLSKDNIWLVPHQANKRIIDAMRDRLELSESRVLVNIHKYGNTTSATIPLLLNEFHPKFKKGDHLIFAAFGGGFTWGASYFKWSI